MQGATVAGLMSFAQTSAGSNPDPSVREALASTSSTEFLPSAAAAVANLNSQTDAASNAADVEKTAYYAQAVVSLLTSCLAFLLQTGTGPLPRRLRVRARMQLVGCLTCNHKVLT